MEKIKEIVRLAKLGLKKKLVLACAQDEHSLGAVNRAVLDGLIDAVLVGNRQEISKVCSSLNIDESNFEIIHEKDEKECLRKAVDLIHDGKADILMKGLVKSGKYVGAILNKEHGLVHGGVLTHVAVFDFQSYPKLLAMSDVAVIPYPTLEQKVVQVKQLAKTTRALGVKVPKIGLVAPSEDRIKEMKSFYDDSDALVQMVRNGEFGDVIVEGPFGADVPISPESVQIKGLGFEINGEADALLMPSLEAGNPLYKFVTKLFFVPVAAVLVGTKAPCVLTSRSDSEDTKFYSIALSILLVD